MSDVVERCAEAIRVRAAEIADRPGLTAAQSRTEMARAAIAAMRKPSDAQLDAALAAVDAKDGYVTRGYVDPDQLRMAWTAGIDAALSKPS